MWAQESVPPGTISAAPTFDATTVYSIALIVVGLIVMVAFGVFGYVVRPALIQLGVSAPQFALDGINSAYESVIKALQDFVTLTPTPLDDAALAELKTTLDTLLEEIRKQRATPPPEGGGVG